MKTLQFVASVSVATSLAAQSVTIYPDGRVMVRTTVQTAVPAGSSVHRILLGNADPGSVIASDPGVHLVSLERSDEDSDVGVFRRAVGRRLAVRFPNGDTASVELVSANPLRYRLPSGLIVMGQSYWGQLQFPPDLLRDPTTAVTVTAERHHDRLALSYLTTGAWWQARYSVRLRPAGSSVTGIAEITSTGLDLDSSEVSLLAGHVGRATAQPGRDEEGMRLDELVVRSSNGQMRVPPPAVSLGVAGHRLYQLAGRHPFQAGQTLTLPLFPAAAADIERVHVIDLSAETTGPTIETPEGQLPARVDIQYRAGRPKGTPFGDRPLPPGIVAIYQEQDGAEVYVGEAAIGHTPPNETLRVDAGIATEVTAKRRASGFEVIQDSVMNRNGSVSVRNVAQLQALEWTLTNAGDQPVTVEITDRRAGKIRIVDSSIALEVAGPTARLRVTVPARGELMVHYRIRIEQP